MRINDILRMGLARHDSQREILELLSHILGKDTTWILSHLDREIPSEETARCDDAFERLSTGEPLPYITHMAWFMERAFNVDSRTLIPRPETTLLVQAVEGLALPPGAKILDVGTGSGCIAGLLQERNPRLTVIALDASMAALAVARKNIPHTPLLSADLLSPFIPAPLFDVIVSNPPYVTRDEMKTLPRSVRDYEPLQALDGGVDGLDFYRALCHSSRKILRKEGFMIFETGYSQANEVSRLMIDAGYVSVAVKKDDAGHGRVVMGQCSH